MALRDIWDNAVDGAFKGGKWGMRLGLAGGALYGLAQPWDVIKDYLFYSFGTAAVYGVAGAVVTMAAGVVAGAAVGAVVGALKSAPTHHHSPSEHHNRAPSPEQGHSPAQDMTPEPPAQSQSFQERVTQSRNQGISQHYR